jgi:hypothetical protein
VDDTETQIHLRAGEAYGWAATCGHKINYANETSACKAAVNQTEKYGRDLEAYPCFFCDGWHIDREMTQEERVKFT